MTCHIIPVADSQYVILPRATCSRTGVPEAASATKLCSVQPIILSTRIAVFSPSSQTKTYKQFTRIKQKASGKRAVHRVLQNCGSAVPNLLHVTFLAPRLFLKFFKNLWAPSSQIFQHTKERKNTHAHTNTLYTYL